MKLAGVKIGLLINFNEIMLKDGLKRFVLCFFVLFVSFVVESEEAIVKIEKAANHGLHRSRTCVRVRMEGLVVPAP
jgi:hypothetical protein